MEVFVAVLLGLVLGLLGPFGTYRLEAGYRIAYWTLMMIAGHAIGRPTVMVSGWLAAETGLPGWAAIAMAVAVGSLPMTLLVAWVLTGFNPGHAVRLAGSPLLYGQVLLISLLANLVFRTVFAPRTPQVDAPLPVPKPPPPIVPANDDPTVATAASPEPSAFAARVPPGFGAPIALCGEDHYVRAYNQAGSTLILMRLRDAIAELDPALDGCRVHRSWWVARHAVTGSRNAGRALRLVLANGLEVPVARERVAQLRANGWF